MSIREFQAKLSFRLLLWSFVSVTSGLLMIRAGQFWNRVGSQFIMWGLIDAAIAVGGQVASDKRLARTLPDDLPEQLHKDKRNLHIALWFNAALDVFYVLGGLRWMRSKENVTARGNGAGVIIQGAFLLVFDVYHALKIRQVEDDN